ncbi:Extracellular protease [Litoreibacter arenae DSM 19593]|uniref:Extracellular protease n=2 Tax=Litoreibacter TaxID=947567 RepID=S9QHK4_9RHOB|nr:Extracellular protease [Litoreibacter arenae DSM 19593]
MGGGSGKGSGSDKGDGGMGGGSEGSNAELGGKKNVSNRLAANALQLMKPQGTDPFSATQNLRGGRQILMVTAPLRFAHSATNSVFSNQIIRVQAAVPSIQLLAGGRICDEVDASNQSETNDGDADESEVHTGAEASKEVQVVHWNHPLPMPETPISETDLAESLGLEAEGLPEEYRTPDNVYTTENDTPQFVLLASQQTTPAALDIIQSLGGIILEISSLPSLDLNMIVIDLAGAVSGAEVRALLAFDGIDADFDMNHIYVGAQGRRSYAHELVGSADFDRCTLPRSVRIGIIDGPVDDTSPFLHNVQMRSHTVLGQTEVPASTSHATGIASLIAAAPAADSVEGLAIGAELFVAVAFADSKNGNIASTQNLVKAIDWLLSEKVEIINMSLAGPHNRTLRRVLSVAGTRGATIVAAAGNDGLPHVAYPGSDPNVIAVTAVDAFKDIYAMASFGDEVEFAAPGVDLLVAEGIGQAYRSGTSYAAAIASAIIAHVIGNAHMSPSKVRDVLRDSATDLGAAGWDPRFGWGLMQLGLCKDEN